MQLPEILRLAGYALGVIGGAFLFLEFFQTPSYVTYDEDFEHYDIDMLPDTVDEHTWLGRIGAFAIALGSALLFVATLIG